MLAQGLRPTAKGGHVAIELAISAQFTAPPPSEAFRPFCRMRNTRNQNECDHITNVDADLVRADHVLAARITEVASVLLPELPVFTG
ncbi:MAG: hypothetical protein FWD74_09225 [Actinomycetia bacterium]|nr:hypothetical protein [Actinomycetes bacterium]